jgi:hypothetical protein
MKKSISFFVSIAPVLTASAQLVLLEDNFNSYSTGTLANDSSWPSAISGTNPALIWSTNSGGPQEIISGSSAGRTGNLFSFREQGTGQTSTFSTVQMNAPYSGIEEWTLAVDFYIQSMPVGVSAGTFGLVTVSNGAVTTDSNILTAVSVTRTNSNTHLNLFVTSGTGGFFWTPTTQAAIELQTWYTLTITGNNNTKALNFNIVGGSINDDRTGSYRFNHNQFDTLSLGDRFVNSFTTGRDNHAYLDNFSLVAVPEPAAYASIFAGLIIVYTLLRQRRK